MKEPPVVVVPKENLKAKIRAAGFDNIVDYTSHLLRSNNLRCITLSSLFRECLRNKWRHAWKCEFAERALVVECGDGKEATEANMREKAAEVAQKFKCDVADEIRTRIRTRPTRRRALLKDYGFRECAREENKEKSICIILRETLLNDFNVKV